MLKEPGGLLTAFVTQVAALGLGDFTGRLRHEALAAPHRPPSAPGCPAVYVFSLSAAYGTSCQAGPDRALKVGMVGANSGPRFSYHHYHPGSVRSSLR